MNEFKSLLQSRTFWANSLGVIALLVPPAAPYVTGVDPGAVAEAVSNAVAVVMFVVSTYTRMIATKRIG
jgi:hypothetical protein